MAEHILALDVGASSLKLAEFAPVKAGGVELVRYGVTALGVSPQSEEDRGQYVLLALREVMRETGIKPGRLMLSVSGQSVFSRFVKLPPVDRDKIRQIIEYEAQQNVPFPIEELVWDYQLLGSTGDIDVMLAAIKADIIQQLTDTVEEAGFNPDIVDVAPMALYNTVRYNYTNLPECTAVLDMGARSTDLIFIEEGRVYSRSIPVAGNAITQQIAREFDLSFEDADQLKRAHAFVAFGGAYEGPQSDTVDKVGKSVRSVMTKLHAEINRSINHYRSAQSGRQPKLLLLTGGSSVMPYTDTFFREKLKVEVDYLNPFLNTAVNEGIDAESIGQDVQVMGQVVGLALRRNLSCPIELNLMPPNVLKDKAFRRKQPYLVAAMVGVLLMVALWAGYLNKLTAASSDRLQTVSKGVNGLQIVERQLAAAEQQDGDIRKKVDTLTRLGSARTRWLEVLDQINASLPDGMWLTAVRPILPKGRSTPAPARRGAPQPPPPGIESIELSGLEYRDKAASAEVVRTFRDALRAQSLFSDATEITWQPSASPEAFVIEFKIMLRLEEPLPL